MFNNPDPDQDIIWSEKDSVYIKLNQNFYMNDYVSSIVDIKTKSDGINKNQFLVEATIKIYAEDQEYIAKPAYIIDDNKVGIIPDIIDDLGIKVYLSEIF